MSVNLPNRSNLKLEEDEYIEVTTFGELKPGDVLVGSQGKVQISHAFDEHLPDSMYELEFDNGVKLRASGNHLLYVVSGLDRECHRNRLTNGKALGKKISAEVIEELKGLASGEVNKGAQTSVRDFIDMLGSNIPGVTETVVRIAESIGHSSENRYYVNHGQDDEVAEALNRDPVMIKFYDCQLFAQQLLSVFNIKGYRKKYPVIVGSVIKVEDLLNMDTEDLYIPSPVEIV